MTKSICSFAWALTLFTGRQLASLAVDPLAPADDFSILLDTLADAMAGRLGPLGQATYEAGDRFQRRMNDSVFGLADDSGTGWGPVIHDDSDRQSRG